MATNHRQPEPERASSDYRYLLGFLNTTWFKAFVILEIFLFVGGYLFSVIGTETEDAIAGSAPDVHMALGGVMGALGVLFAAFFVITIGFSLWLRLQKVLEPNVTF